MEEKATLYIVPTPIGNLGDITLRALEVLGSVDLIVCEDTRHTIKLLNHYGIKKTLISYERFSEAKRLRSIMEQLEAGRNIALVSDAGTPAVSDPGSSLIRNVRESGFGVTALPGASALVTALSASGFEGGFRFIGFFPRKEGMINKELLRIKASKETVAFYESPRRIKKTLWYMLKNLGDREVFLAREISKKYEQYINGTSGYILERLQGMDRIGELTVLVKGSTSTDTIDESHILERARFLLESGYSKKDILQVLVEESGLARNRIYQLLVKIN